MTPSTSDVEAGVLPADLQNVDHWLTRKATPDGRKVPRAPYETGGDDFVSAQDPEMWTSFDTAREWGRLSPHGLTFTIPPRENNPDDPYVLVDYDARNPETGGIHPVVHEHIDRAGLDHEEIMGHARAQVEMAVAGLYIEYHAHKRFANEVLDVSFEEFLALSPPGWLDDVDFGVVLEGAKTKDQIPDSYIANDEDTEEIPLEDAVEMLYDELVRNWTSDCEEGSP